MRIETILVALALSAGCALTLSPWLWPAVGRKSRKGNARLRLLLDAAGHQSTTPATFVIFSALLGVAAIGVGIALTGIIAVALLSGIMAAIAPFAFLRIRVTRRRSRLDSVWPDLVDHIIGSLRAGRPLADAICALESSVPGRLGEAFAQFRRDYQRSASFDRSLDLLRARIAHPVCDRLSEILRMANEVGGADLVNVLRALSAYLREDAAARSELAARQSWISNAARLGLVAPWVVLLALATRPEAREAYNSPGGFTLIVAGAVACVLAFILMRAVSRLPQEARWV